MFTFKKLTLNKIDKLTDELFEIQNKKREIEIENKHLAETISTMTSQKERELKETEHKQRLVLQDAEAKFARAKSDWEIDKARLYKELSEDKIRQEKFLKEDYERKYNEAVTLLKLDSEQRIKQQELDFNRKVQEIETKHQEAIREIKNHVNQEKMGLHARLTEDYYENLKTALVDLHTKGNTTTQFVQELALKMLERPLGASITENRLLINPEHL